MKKKINNHTIEDFNILNDNVLIKSIVVTERKGVIIPETYETKPELGTVEKIGTGRLLESGSREDLTVAIGDIVYFNKYSTTKFSFNGDDFYVVREEDIVAYIR